MPQGERSELFPFSMAQTVTPSHTPKAFQVSAEAIVGSLHTSTHVDAICHVLSDAKVFGGIPEDEVRTYTGWRTHCIETVPPIVGRFLFADIAAWHDVNELPVDHEISVDELDDCLSAGKISVQNGDIVLIRTGKARGFYESTESYGRCSPGLGSMLASSFTAAAPQCWRQIPPGRSAYRFLTQTGPFIGPCSLNAVPYL